MKLTHWLESLRTRFSSNRTQRRILKRHRTEHKQIPANVENLEERVLLSSTTYDVTPDSGDTNSAATGDVDPTSIDHDLIPEETVTDIVTLTFEDESQIPTADIIFVVDESGSMGGEHAWITEMALDLEASLELEGVTDNRFALVGYLDKGSLFNMSPAEFSISIYDSSGTLVDSAVVSPEYEDNSAGNSGFINAEFNLPSDGTYYAVVETTDLDDQGIVSIDAENYDTATAGSSGDTWSVEGNYSASGGEVVEAGPDNGTSYGSGSVANAPRLDYEVNLEAGTYHVWLRGREPNDNGDRVHVGMDSQVVTRSGFGTLEKLSWVEASATITASTSGTRTLSLWMGEDGVIIDKIVLTKDTNYTPTGQGPSESLQDGSGVYQQNTSSLEFSFLFEDNSSTVTSQAVTLNEPYRNVVTPTATEHTYTFTLGSSTDLFFESLTPDASYEWTLTGPSGDLVTDRGFDLNDSLLTAAAGSYTLTVNAVANSSGHYGFRMIDLSAPTAITTGSSTTAMVNPVDESVVYSLAVTSGNQYYFNATSWDGTSGARWRLVDDSGNVLFDSALSDDQDLLTASSTGTYYLIVEGDVAETASTARSFDFTVEDLGSVASRTQALTLGTAVSSSLSTIGEEEHYTFTLGSAALLYLDSFTDSTSLNWSLTGPGGNVIESQAFTSGNQVLSLASGSYTLSVDGAGEANGSFSFLLESISSLASTITPDTAESDTLNPAGKSHVYQFTVTAGDKYSFDSQSWSGSSAARWKLVDPYGNILFDETLSSDVGTIHFHEGGTYSLLIEGDEADSGTPGYTVEVISQGTDTSSPAPLDLSQVVSGNISASLEQDTFTFTLGSGGLYYFDAITDNGPVRWSLSGSTSGSVVTNRTFASSNANDVADGDVILDLAADTYTLTIDADTGVTGDYAFQLSELSTVATALTSGVGATAAFTSRSSQVYSFSATANDRFHLTMEEWGGASDALWRVVDSSGGVVTSGALGAGTGNVTLTAGGAYYLLIEGDSAETVLNRALDFEIELEAMTQTAALTLGSLVMDSISTAGDTHEYTFTGTAGETLLLDFDSAATTDHQILLRSPSGEVLLTTNYSSSNVVTQISSLTLEETGGYQLVVSAENSSTGAYEFQLSVKSDLVLDHDVAGELDGVSA
ncbi:MAG: hypothetical protein KDA65_04295, partial [Planctomycetaceae bacterium]|nr:hypothetical protein [Planctomycetaceae bacterium]